MRVIGVRGHWILVHARGHACSTHITCMHNAHYLVYVDTIKSSSGFANTINLPNEVGPHLVTSARLQEFQRLMADSPSDIKRT